MNLRHSTQHHSDMLRCEIANFMQTDELGLYLKTCLITLEHGN